MKVYNMTSPRTGREVANQFVIEDNQVTVFQSYQSTIATLDYAKRICFLGEDWDYSSTTGKYRNQFFYEFNCPSLETKKGIEHALCIGYFKGPDGHDWEIKRA